MANQYSGSFEHKVFQRFGLSAEDFLKQCVNEGLSYAELEKKTGFTRGTLRKWATRFELSLNTGIEENKIDEFSKYFSDPQVNMHNFLSRRWTNGMAGMAKKKALRVQAS